MAEEPVGQISGTAFLPGAGWELAVFVVAPHVEARRLFRGLGRRCRE